MNLAGIRKRAEQLQASLKPMKKVVWLNPGDKAAGEEDTLYIRWSMPGEQVTIIPLSPGRHSRC